MRNKKGFTLVEMSLSIAFIGVLSIIVVVVIINAISSYRRGITLNQLNTVGMSLVDDMRAAVRRSPGFEAASLCQDNSTCNSDGGYAYVYDVVKEADGSVSAGVFCTGSYSYLWNSGNVLRENGTGVLKLVYKKTNNATAEGFRLLKVEDEDRLVCKNANLSGSNYVNGNKINQRTINITTKPVSEEPVDLLGGGDSGLVVYGLTSSRPASGGVTNSSLYYISLTMGTLQGGVINSSNCAAPASGNSEENFDFCAINNFNFAAQAIGSI